MQEPQCKAPTSTRMAAEIQRAIRPRPSAVLWGVAASVTLYALVLFAHAAPAVAQTPADLVREGFAAKERRQYPYAVRLFDEALRRGDFPFDQRGFVYYSRGVSYEALGLRDRALGDLDAAIALLPEFPNSYIYRALIWSDRREFELARDDLLQALRLAPANPLVHANIASVYLRTDQLDLAIEHYGTAVRLDPGYAEAFYNRAQVFIAKQDFHSALADYDRAIGLRKDFADAYSNRGGVHFMQGDTERAIADFGEAIRLRESDPVFWTNRANVYFALGRSGEAMNDFDRAHMIDPGNVAVYLGRARVRIYSDANAAAVEDLRTAVRLRPSNPNPAIWLHISRVHQAYDDRRELEENAARVKLGQWPGAVLDLYLGKRDVDGVRRLAGEGTGPQVAKRLCEADFFIGEFFMHSGKATEGRQILKSVGANCPPAEVVFGAANAELGDTTEQNSGAAGPPRR